MTRCENAYDGAVSVETHTGPTRNAAVCDIGPRADIRHFVTVRSELNYLATVKIEVRIDSHPRLIHFEQLPGQTDVEVKADGWKGTCVLPEGSKAYTFDVGLRSDQPNGGDQDIKVSFVITRFADDDEPTAQVLPLIVGA